MKTVVHVKISSAAVTTDRRETKFSPVSASEDESLIRTDICCLNTASRVGETQPRAGEYETSVRKQAASTTSDRLIVGILKSQ